MNTSTGHAGQRTGTLFLIPTTLGESALAEVLPPVVQQCAARLRHFVGENAKTTRAFLKLAGIETPLQQVQISELNVNTLATALPTLLQPLLDGHDTGLVSEAGCPAVADPGSALVQLAHQHGITVKPLVGPSSLLLALMASGLNGQAFAFNGYLPTDPAQRAQRLRELEKRSRQEGQTQLCIETPYRNQALFDALLQTLSPATWLCVACELTTANEKITTQRVADWKKRQATLPRAPAVFLFLAE
ncbi:MAG: SAM-dependent methyltransferase [Burkholderiaceae bacterium]|nr:MAG: SAM-dependent methyltransferase [Burkholderiaceae bacterium]